MIALIKNKLNERGGAAVEFGLILPIFLLLLIAVIEYGWYFTHEIVLSNAVSEGARRAIKEEDEADIKKVTYAAVREAFWLHDLEKDGGIENVVNVIIPDDNPKRVIVTIPVLGYNQLTGFMPSKMVPETIGAKAVMTFL
ncbi:MAG: pilus assembly protein [Deltaproteobacteria bacterium]|nr:pilus assembly protein [Deltaproteobacteria bacterium]